MDAILEEEEDNFSCKSERGLTEKPEENSFNSSAEIQYSATDAQGKELIGQSKSFKDPEMFPDLVRGINIKSTIRKVKSLHHETARFSEPGKKNDNHLITEDSRMLTENEPSPTPKEQRRTRPRKKTEYSKNLQKVSQGVRFGNEYDTLKMVMAHHDFSGKKKMKKSELFLLACEEWEKTEVFYRQTKDGAEILKASNDELDNNYNQELEDREQLEEDLKHLKAQIIDEKIQFDTQREDIHNAIAKATKERAALLKTKADTAVKYSQMVMHCKEKEEQWLMRLEDHHTLLLELGSQTEKAQAELAITQEAIRKIEYHRQLQEQQQADIHTLANLLRQVTEFTSESQDVQFFESFAGMTRQLQTYTVDTIDIYKNFVKQATTDPKTLLPYTRTSKPLRA